MKKEDLLRIIGEDELGLLKAKSDNSSAITADQRLVDSFEEINHFMQVHNREPEIGKEIQEHRLATRLQSIRKSKDKCEALKEIDLSNLLDAGGDEVHSVNDIILDDDLGILSREEEDLFDLKNIPQQKDRKSADIIERRKPCKNFSEYEELFKKCQKELASGKRVIRKFSSEKEIQKNAYYVLNGILLLIIKLENLHNNEIGKLNGTQKCIFENGTESKMQVRSLVKALFENGYVVSENIDTDGQAVLENFSGVTEDDSKTGFIYVVRSLSRDPKIQPIENLYKIGYSTIPVEERIKDAHEDPSYLMAPVSIVTSFECYNFNPQKLEQLLHNFFGSACLNIDIFNGKGQRHSPREWFIAPLNIIERAIALILNGGIVSYKYDSDKQDIVLR